MLSKFLTRLKTLKSSERGAIAIYFAVAIPMFMGFGGLALDTAMWLSERRNLQHTVDSAAIAAAYALKVDDQSTNTELVADAKVDASYNSFTTGGSNTLVVQHPPTAGSFVGNTNVVRVELASSVDGFFSQFFGYDDLTVKTVASAGVFTTSQGSGCVIGLNGSEAQTIDMTGNTGVDLTCGISSNSTHAYGLSIGGSANVTASAVNANGGINFNGSGHTANIDSINPNQGELADPYEHLEIPSKSSSDYPGCDVTNYSAPNGNGALTLDPGRYCGGLDIGRHDVTLNPGTYIIDGGDLSSSAHAHLTGDGVTIILTGDNPSDIGNFDLHGQATIDITARTTTQIAAQEDASSEMMDYAGVAMYQDRRTTDSSNVNKINGGSDLNINGVVYFPSQQLWFLGNADIATNCTLVIADKVKFSGTSDFKLTNTAAACADFDIDLTTTIDLVKLME